MMPCVYPISLSPRSQEEQRNQETINGNGEKRTWNFSEEMFREIQNWLRFLSNQDFFRSPQPNLQIFEIQEFLRGIDQHNGDLPLPLRDLAKRFSKKYPSNPYTSTEKGETLLDQNEYWENDAPVREMKGSNLYDKELKKNRPTCKNDHESRISGFAGTDLPIAHHFAQETVADFREAISSIKVTPDLEKRLLEPHKNLQYNVTEHKNLRTTSQDLIEFALPGHSQDQLYVAVPHEMRDSDAEASMKKGVENLVFHEAEDEIRYRCDMIIVPKQDNEESNSGQQSPKPSSSINVSQNKSQPEKNADGMSFVPMSLCERTCNVQMAKDNLKAIWDEICSKQPKLPLAEPSKRETLEEGVRQEYKTIGGERIRICDCELELPENCFKEQTNVSVAVEVDSSKWPDGYVGISPMIHVNSEREFEKPAMVNLTTWCTSDGSELSKHQTVHVLHKPKDADEWEVLCQLPLAEKRNNCLLRFSCMDFSPVFVGILEIECDSNREYIITGVIYPKPGNILLIIFFFDHESIWEHIEKIYKVPDQREVFNPISVKIDDVIGANLEVEDGDITPGSFSFIFDQSFLNQRRFAKFSKMSQRDAVDVVYVTAKIVKNEDDLDNEVQFSCNWEKSNTSKSHASRGHENHQPEATNNQSPSSIHITTNINHFHQNERINAGVILQRSTASMTNRDSPSTIGGFPASGRLSPLTPSENGANRESLPPGREDDFSSEAIRSHKPLP